MHRIKPKWFNNKRRVWLCQFPTTIWSPTHDAHNFIYDTNSKQTEIKCKFMNTTVCNDVM